MAAYPMTQLTDAALLALALSNGAPVALLVERANGDVVVVNHLYRDLFELGDAMPSDPLGRAADSCVEPSLFIGERPLDARRHQLRLRQRNGRMIERQVRAIRDGDRLEGWVWSCVDVTFEDEAVSALARVTDFYKRVLDALPAQLAVFSPAGAYEYVTPSAIADPAVREWIIGKTDAEYGVFRGLPTAVWQQRRQLIRDVIAGGGSRTFDETFATRTGEIRHFRRFLSPVFDADGALLHVLGYGLDVTELYRTQEQLHYSQKMDAIGRLAGGVAHDFNNLLTVVVGNAANLKEELESDDNRQELVQGILEASNRATELTTQLLSFSRGATIEPQAVALNQVVEETMRLLRRLIGEQIQIQLTLTPASSAVHADPSRLKQVLMNLAVNARDAMPEGGTLTVSTHRRRIELPADATATQLPMGDYVELVVADTGTGIPATIRERLFEPFFTTKEVGKGTGLGLSMVYGIVTQTGGQIQVESALNVGSTFRVLLPAMADEAAR